MMATKIDSCGGIKANIFVEREVVGYEVEV